ALLRRAVGERFGDGVAARLLLQPVVAYRRRGGESLLDVARVERATLLRRVAPDSGEAVRLQLDAHRLRVARPLRRAAAEVLPVAHQPELVLDVMTDLVGDDIGAREIARRAEALRKLPEELQIQIDVLVAGTVERAHRRAGEPACRIDATLEQRELRLLVT